jgi:type II secretion system protein D
MSLIRIIALILVACSCVFAQEPAPPAAPEPSQGAAPPPAVPVRGRQGLVRPNAATSPSPQATNGGEPAADAPKLASAPDPKPDIPLGENTITEDIVEPKLSGNALAGLYRKYTGRRVIVSAAAAEAEFSFVQEASPQDPLTFNKAAELLRKAATIENFVFVPDEQDPKLDILTLATGGIRPTGRGVDVYNENDPLPEGDAVISYVMTLNYIKPAEAVNTFTQIIGQFGAFGSIAAVPNASAVVITENTSLIRKLIDLKKEIDKPGSVQATRFIKVQYADVTEIAETISGLLSAQQESQKTAGIQRTDATPAATGNPAQAATPGATSAGEDTPVQIVPDPRTNRIFAMGRPVDLLFVEGLVREFDVETSEKNFLRRKLKFLTVSEFLPIASDALTRAFTGTGGEGGQTGTQGGTQNANRPQAQPRQDNTTGSSRTSSRNSNGRNSTMGNNSTGSGGSFGGGGGLSDPSVSTAPESALVGRTLLVADNITNSIVVQGPPAGLEIVQRLIDQLDTKPDQVMISTVIGQLALNKNFEFGVGYLLNGNDGALGGGGGLPIIPIAESILDPAKRFPIIDPSGLGASGLRAYGTIGDLNVFLKALQSKTDFTVLSRPSIFTANNQKGTISSGERIAIPTQGGTSGGNYNTGTSIEYQDVVLKLEVIPLVNSNNEITLQISLINDEQNGTQTIAGAGTNGGDLSVPRITTREILTTATVPNGQTIALGGLIVGKKDKTKSGIPVLSDIPYVGNLFSTTTTKDDRSELMIFIQPTIVSSSKSLNETQVDFKDRYTSSPEITDFADPPPPEAVPVEESQPAKKPKPNFRPPNRQ